MIRKKRAVLIGPLLRPGKAAERLLRELGVSATSNVGNKRRSADILIGVDGGVRAADQLGLMLDLAVGDWDSLSPSRRVRLLKGIPSLTFPREKDESDLFLATQAALNAGATEIIAIGVTGGRPDHHLAMLLELGVLAGSGKVRKVSAWGPEASYHFISRRTDPWIAHLSRGQIVSVFALGGVTEGVTLKGLKHKLTGAKLSPSSRGLSNLAAKKTGEVRVRGKGTVVVIVPSSTFEVTQEEHVVQFR